MGAKQFWQKNLWWLLAGWMLFSLWRRPGWVVFGAGVLFWVFLLYLSAPGVFWNYLAHLVLDPEKSKAFFQKALDAGAVIPRPYLSLGILLCRQKKWQEALPLLEKAVELSRPRFNTQANLLTAIAYRETGAFAKALEALEKLQAGGYQTTEVYLNLALTYLRQNRLEEALQAAKKARSLDYQNSDPVLLMGKIHFAMGDYEAAKNDYEWAITHLSWPVETYYWLGRCKLELGENEAAAEHLKTAVERIKEDPLLADVPVEEAEEWYRRAVESAQTGSEKKITPLPPHPVCGRGRQ